MKKAKVATHSLRKAAASYAAGGTDGTPMHFTILLRGGWSIGNVLDRYFHLADDGDRKLANLLAGRQFFTKEFGQLVPHFTKNIKEDVLLGVFCGDYIAQELMKKTDVECRVTSLGHVQRGAPPTASDRILASAFGVYAVDLLNQKKFDRMVAWRDRRVVDVPIDEGIKTYKNVERKDSLVETALSLGIYLGDDI